MLESQQLPAVSLVFLADKRVPIFEGRSETPDELCAEMSELA